MKLFATLKLLAVYLTLGPLVGIVGIPWTLLTKDITWMYWAAMWVTRAGVRAAGIKVEKRGYENIPAGRACIFMCNHVSNLDPPVLLPAIPGMTSVFLKRELMRIPLLGTAMRMGKFVPVSRGHSRDEAQRSVAAAKEALASGLHITVFPEGTRSPDGKLLPFKKGAFFLAAETEAPMVPVVITGTAEMMPKGTLKMRPGTAIVRFLPVIEPAAFGSREDLMEAVREAMMRGLAARD